MTTFDAMDWFKRFRRRRILFPRWFFESTKGTLMARLGQIRDDGGNPEIVIRFEARGKYGRWKPIGTFRYVDSVHVQYLLMEADKTMRKLIASE